MLFQKPGNGENAEVGLGENPTACFETSPASDVFINSRTEERSSDREIHRFPVDFTRSYADAGNQGGVCSE